MDISIEHENENLFYIYLVLNILGYNENNGKPLPDVRKKVQKDFEHLKNNSKIAELQKLWDSERIYVAYLLYFAFSSSDQFQKISVVDLIREEDEYIDHLEFIKILKAVIKQEKLRDYYLKVYLPSINCNIKKLSSVEIDNVFESYWGFLLPMDGVIYETPLEAYARGRGLEIGNLLISVKGPSNVVRGEPTFDSELALMSFIHEASHFYAQRIRDELIELDSSEYKRKCNKLYKVIKSHESSEVWKETFDFYQYWEKYFEETIVRVSETAFLSPSVFNKDDKYDGHFDKKKKGQRDVGFVLIDIVEEEIQKEIDNNGSIAQAWVNSIDRALKEYVIN